MTTFDKREQGFESKFALDQEKEFKAVARRNRLLGEWAAGLLGKSGDEARDYAMSVVAKDFEEPGDEDVIGKLIADLSGLADEATIRAKVAETLVEARRQVLEDGQ